MHHVSNDSLYTGSGGSSLGCILFGFLLHLCLLLLGLAARGLFLALREGLLITWL
jgi:hypothetical protein